MAAPRQRSVVLIVVYSVLTADAEQLSSQTRFSKIAVESS
jgi:hypothetical protein